jgi:hypothetical protein
MSEMCREIPHPHVHHLMKKFFFEIELEGEGEDVYTEDVSPVRMRG